MDERYTEGYTGENRETRETGGQTEQQHELLESAGQEANQEAGQQSGQENGWQTDAAGYMEYAEAGGAAPEKKMKKAKKARKASGGPMSMKKRWAVLVSMALVFGAVAGGTAFGVNVAASSIYDRQNAENNLSNTETASSSGSTEDKGTVAQVAINPMSSGRTLAVHMYNLLNEGLAREAAYATAVVLLILVVGINALSSFVAKKFTKA